MQTPRPTTPPLENGDRLSRHEFERRYHAMPRVKKAELIAGTVFMASPLHFRGHGNPHAWLMGWLVVYEASTPGVLAGDNTTVRLDDGNEFQPDALLRRDRGGRSTISDDDYITGAPELVIEIAASSASIDLGTKRDIYHQHQVQDYLVWRVYDQALDWFHWQTSGYASQQPDPDGWLRSTVFPGLWLDRNALLAGQLGQVLNVLQQGINSDEHRDFCTHLAATS
ncbi:MAG: Uma2 family endonuclease [Spirulinaceae cyanobacterium SM2_1_0]|nr:Uma2 family endonuclease [Spirulinaceae cyanobacterium SM2_1_0]